MAEPSVDVDVERLMREGFTGRLRKRLDWTDRAIELQMKSLILILEWK